MNIFDGKISGFLLPTPHKKSSYPLPHPPFFDHNRMNISRKQTKNARFPYHSPVHHLRPAPWVKAKPIFTEESHGNHTSLSYPRLRGPVYLCQSLRKISRVYTRSFTSSRQAS